MYIIILIIPLIFFNVKFQKIIFRELLLEIVISVERDTLQIKFSRVRCAKYPPESDVHNAG